MADIWIATGVSGSGRKELLLRLEKESKGKIVAYDMGETMLEVASSHDLNVTNEKILDIDDSALILLRANAVQEILCEIEENKQAEIHIVGVHAVFPWRGRIISGISFENLQALEPKGIFTVVDDVNQIKVVNQQNPKWLGLDEFDTQYWMMVEEHVSKLYSSFLDCPFYVIAQKHNESNLADLILGKKKHCIYLSYPITAIRKSDPEFLDRLEKEVLPELYKLFVVFNPLDIKDLATLTSDDDNNPQMKDVNLLKKERTVERDYSFIDQSDAIVVFYKTDKHSPGVAAEIEYAHRNSKEVFMYYPYKKSPFLERAVDEIIDSEEVFWSKLQHFSGMAESQEENSIDDNVQIKHT